MLCAAAIGLRAQDYPVTALDGPDLRVDSLSVNPSEKPAFVPFLAFPSYPMVQVRPTLLMPAFETKEQRAARINQQTFNAVMLSMDRDLYWHRIPEMSKPWRMAMAVAGLFLSNPYAFPEGCVPLMNASFPFIYARTPGMAPYGNPYTSDQFTKCIESEYDFATGTYRQVMVDWSEVQSKMSKNSFYQTYEAVPQIPVTPVERMMAR